MNDQSIDISQSLRVPGWMTPKELEWLAAQAREHWACIEVGVWKGRSTLALLQNCPGHVIAVDHFLGAPGSAAEREAKASGGDAIYLEFFENTFDFDNLILLRCRSSTAAKVLKRIGWKASMVFLDADHSADSVANDITAFRPLMPPGSLLCGHDIDRDTVQLGLSKAGIENYGRIETIWFVQI